MSTYIKPLNVLKTKFTINGKLAVLTYSSADKTKRNIVYSKKLTEKENQHFKEYLIVNNII